MNSPRRLRSQIRSCHRCPLGEFSDAQEWQRVPWVGSKSNVAVIGEAPGKNEALQGEPFVGRAGKVLDEALESAGLSRDSIWIQNVICCRPQGNDFDHAISVGAVESCRPWFNRQLELSGAWLVVLVGKQAYRTVMEEDVPLTHVRGRGQWLGGRLYFPMWHPAYVLRKGPESQVRGQWEADWGKIRRFLDGEIDVPPITEMKVGQMRLQVASSELGKIRERLRLDGWVGVWSPVIEDYLLVVDNARKQGRIPAKWKRMPRWTTEELQKVNAGGELSISVQELQRINLAKRVLGAKVVA